MKFVIEKNWINVIGMLWKGGLATHTYELTQNQVEIIGKPVTRKKIAQWLSTNSGDFQTITDFLAVVGEQVIIWKKEENEVLFDKFWKRNKLILYTGLYRVYFLDASVVEKDNEK